MLRPSDLPNTDGGTAERPYGRLRDDVVAGDGTGTPVRTDWLQNIYYAILAVLFKAGIAPDGTAETASVSQFADAVRNAGNLATGTLLDARLSSNVPLKDSANTFTNNQIISKNGVSVNIDPNASTNFAITPTFATSGTFGLDAIMTDGTSGMEFRIGRSVSTSGTGTFVIKKMDGTNTNVHVLSKTGASTFNDSNQTIGTTGFRYRGLGAITGTALVIDANGYIGPTTSSEKYKKDIEDMDIELAEKVVNLVRPVYYKNKVSQSTYPDDWSYWGVIAEELAEIDPRLVNWGYWPEDYEEVVDEEDEEYTEEKDGEIVVKTRKAISKHRELKPDAELSPIGVQYDRIAVLMLKVMQKDRQRLNDLEKRLAKLEGKSK